MNCLTARLLLPYLRPGGRDLDADDLAAVQAHLAGCSACQAAAGAERHFDALVGQAMRQVQPPVELRHRLLVRLARDRRRFWARRVSVGVGAAALVVAGLLGAYAIHENNKPPLNIAELSNELGGRDGARPDEVAAFFHDQHLPFAVPPDLNFDQLLNYGTGTLLGRKVPALLFVHFRPDRSASLAEVYVLHESEFRVTGLAVGLVQRDDASNRSVFVVRSPQEPAFAFVIVVYNGQLEDFQTKPTTGPRA